MLSSRCLYMLCATLMISICCHAQFENTLISKSYQEKPLEEVLNELQVDLEVKFFFKKQWLENKFVTTQIREKNLTEALELILKDQNLTYIVRQPNYIVLLPDTGSSSKSITVDNSLNGRISIGNLNARIETAIISGIVIKGIDSSPLEATIITVEGQTDRYVSLADGTFKISLPVGNYKLKFHHPTMVDFDISVALNSDGDLNVKMFEDVTVLDEIVISAQAIDQNISKTISGQDIIDIKTIKAIPAFFGEADVLNSVLSLPGVSKVGEGSSGINVRGGGVGQNLILVDNATVFNPSHLFGFFSTFNVDAVSRVNLYRGGVPVEYGGRLSSVMDIEIKNGNKEKLSGRGGIGIVNSRLMLEGPINDSTTFLAAIRAAYPNYLLRGREDEDLSTSSSFFGDGNLKIDHLINSKNRISLNGYASRDQFDFSEELEYEYGNATLGLEWNGQLSDKLFTKTSASYTNYNYEFGETSDVELAALLESEIEQLTLNSVFENESDEHLITFGTSLTFTSISPGTYSKASEVSIIEPLEIDEERAFEGALFVGDQFQLNDQLSLYGGIRYSFFKGGKKGIEEFYHGPEPRLSINYKASPTSSIKLGYNRMRQYIHFVSNTVSATPIDLWKLSNDEIEPQTADQVTLGYFRNFQENLFETSIEAFYKKTGNLIEYKNAADLFINENIEDELIQGKGRAYGIEFLMKKTRGKLTGWLSYTYSRSLIQVKDSNPANTINNGSFFPTNFDQPHNLSAFSNIKLTRRYSINANFVYNTGRPVSFPESIYQIRGVSIVDFAERNKYRIPNYHRLDVSLVMNTTLKKEKKIEANWSFSIYNLYGRQNTYSVYFKNDPITGEPQTFRLSILARPIFAISYNFKF